MYFPDLNNQYNIPDPNNQYYQNLYPIFEEEETAQDVLDPYQNQNTENLNPPIEPQYEQVQYFGNNTYINSTNIYQQSIYQQKTYPTNQNDAPQITQLPLSPPRTIYPQADSPYSPQIIYSSTVPPLEIPEMNHLQARIHFLENETENNSQLITHLMTTISEMQKKMNNLEDTMNKKLNFQNRIIENLNRLNYAQNTNIGLLNTRIQRLESRK